MYDIFEAVIESVNQIKPCLCAERCIPDCPQPYHVGALRLMAWRYSTIVAALRKSTAILLMAIQISILLLCFRQFKAQKALSARIEMVMT